MEGCDSLPLLLCSLHTDHSYSSDSQKKRCPWQSCWFFGGHVCVWKPTCEFAVASASPLRNCSRHWDFNKLKCLSESITTTIGIISRVLSPLYQGFHRGVLNHPDHCFPAGMYAGAFVYSSDSQSEVPGPAVLASSRNLLQMWIK